MYGMAAWLVLTRGTQHLHPSFRAPSRPWRPELALFLAWGGS